MSQQCNKCGIDKDISEYYLINGCHPKKECKQCIRSKIPKKPYANGWVRLDAKIRQSVIAKLQDRRIKIHDIADEYGINYSNLCYWMRSGRCV